MGKLVELKAWKDQRFENLSLRTAQHLAKNGEIPGAKKIGRKWYVDPDIEKQSTGNAVVDSILMSG